MKTKIYSSILDFCSLDTVNIRKALKNVQTDRVCGFVFCGTSDTVQYHDLLYNLKSIVYESLGRVVPVTLIPQYLLPDGGFSVEIYTLDGTDEIHVANNDGVCHGLINNGNESILFIEGIPSSDFSESVSQQSDEVFCRLDNLLSLYGFKVDDIVRQWNYIGNIVSYRDGKQNYQEFNDARSRYYDKGKWSNGYPAATGIGVSSEGIIVGGIAFKKEGGIYPIDNPLQVAAHVYSKEVLIDYAPDAVKSTPKFERAKLIETAEGACCFVSGTAAIRGEASTEISSARSQTVMTIENIDNLVSEENLVRYGCKAYGLKYVKLHVFVKNAEDYEEVKSVVDEMYPQIPAVYTIADVCRSELLVEIEGILIS